MLGKVIKIDCASHISMQSYHIYVLSIKVLISVGKSSAIMEHLNDSATKENQLV